MQNEVNLSELFIFFIKPTTCQFAIALDSRTVNGVQIVY